MIAIRWLYAASLFSVSSCIMVTLLGCTLYSTHKQIPDLPMYRVSGSPLVKRSANLMLCGGSGCFLICRLIACMKADSGLIATGGRSQNIKSLAL